MRRWRSWAREPSRKRSVRWPTYWMLLVVVVMAGVPLGRTPQAQAPTEEDKSAGQKNPPKHGLMGAYYLSNLETHTDTKPWGNYFVQVWIDDNDFGLPRTFGPPAATRVDAQIAFGKGQGFSKAGDSSRTSWGPTDYSNLAGWTSNSKPDSIAAVIWKGYIHFPKPGTYSFATLSRGASAVYLNSARVVLNGRWAGGMPSDAFSYADSDIVDYIQNVASGRKDIGFSLRPNETYIVPVPIDRPRDLPIEVQYQAWAHDHQGIDLFWVTPDSAKDANGKPIAQIVPPDVLYTDPPSTAEPAVVGNANSTVSTDFLYFPTESLEGWVTVKVRLADKNGNPVPGKQVHVSTLTSFGGPDTIEQPEKPTDENGITTAKMHGNKDYSVTHESQIFATDVTDLVDSAQVAHVNFQTPPANPFFPDAFSPYYDPNMPNVEPLPLQVGTQVTIKMPLVNRSKFAADLTAVFESNDANIGAVGWHEIGRVKNIRLQPGEHKDVSIAWTPETTSSHVCFRVGVNAKMISAPGASLQAASPVLASLVVLGRSSQEINSEFLQRNIGEKETSASLASLPVLGQPGGDINGGSLPKGGFLQRNIGAVKQCTPGGMALYTLLGGGIADFCFNGPCRPDNFAGYGYRYVWEPYPDGLKSEAFDGGYVAKRVALCSSGGGTTKKTLPPLHLSSRKTYPASHSPQAGGSESPDSQSGDTAPSSPLNPIDAGKDTSAQGAAGFTNNCDGFLVQAQDANRTSDEAHYQAWMRMYRDCVREQGAWNGVASDPPDPSYRRLAVAAFDTPVGYLDAARISMERFQAAQAGGDVLWSSRHLTAMELYFKQLAKTERRAAEEDENAAAQFSPDSQKSIQQRQADYDAVYRRLKNGTPPDDLKQLKNLGFSEDEAKGFYSRLASQDAPPQFPGSQGTLLLSAALRRQLASQAEAVAALSPSHSGRDDGFFQTFVVGNPHDREETVQLLIRPISIPPDWKLSIVNAEAVEVPSKLGAPAPAPKYPVQASNEPLHYSVTLPAKTEMKVASVVVPVGEIGARTTARWAVEGRIGNELLGGIVHEMNVPYIIADLKLPPVGSKEEEFEQTTSGKFSWRLGITAAAGVAALATIVLIVFFVKRRRREEKPAV